MALMLPEVTTCCGCTSLETGAKIIGFSHTILAGASAVYLVFEEINFFFKFMRDNSEENYARTFVYFTDIGVTLHFIFAFYLLQGIYNKKAYYLMSWVILQISTLIVGAFMLLIAICSLIFEGPPYNIKSIQMRFDRLVIGILFSFLSGYTILVVFSYYKKMQKMTQSQR
ncbi:hypothetical protein O3M35_011744 [Rhynocoris fuscipes]|uniref:Uncharacterized protein n=1 Tax=Rhynocoris fuscipes TaxID=488301 RepID=A0AAW1CWV3_9HEMI